MGIVVRQSIKAAIINYIGALIGFFTTMFVVTKFLQPNVIGLTKIIYEIAALIAGFAQLGTTISVMRFFPYFRNPENNHNGFFFYLMLVPSVGMLIFVILFLVLKGPVINFFENKSALLVEYYNWIIPLIIFIVYWTVLETYANVLLRIVVPKFIREIEVRMLMLVLYLLYAFHILDLNGLVIGFVIAYGFVMLSAWIYIASISSVSLKHNFSFLNKDLITKFLKYTLYLVIGALSGNIISQLDIFMVSSQMGLNYTGIYTIAIYMAALIEIPARSITAIANPLAATALKEGNLYEANQLYKKVSLHQLIAGSILFLLMWINIDNIFAIIPNGQIYVTGKWVVFFLALSRLVSMTLSFGGTLILFSRYYYWGLYFTFFLTFLTILSNYWLIPLFGITGAAIATALTCVISYSLQQWLVLKKVKGNPYSAGTFKQIGLILVLLLCNRFIPQWSDNPFIDGAYRSFIIAGAWAFGAYKFRVSEELCGLMRKYIFRK